MSACRLGWHEWTKWRPCKVRSLAFGRDLGVVTGQVRECRSCGREQVR